MTNMTKYGQMKPNHPARVAFHADLVMLARLGQALCRAREVVPLAA